jgi:hypothetical protein
MSEQYDALSATCMFRVSWRINWNYLGESSEGQMFCTRTGFSPSEDYTVPALENLYDSVRCRAWSGVKMTGTAIAFNDKVVMVRADNRKIYLLEPSCLIVEDI